MERNRIGIVIPALNEAKSIAPVVAKALPFGRVIVVNDGSTDSTRERALEAGAHVVSHDKPKGYDAALDRGFQECKRLNVELAITLDADGQHDPELIREFISKLSETDLVVGIRPKTQRLAEWLFAKTTQVLFGINDPLCGMKGYRLSWYDKLGHFDSYQSIGTELFIKSVRNGATFAQIPIPIRERDGAPRFGKVIQANLKIFRAMILGLLPRAS